MPTRWILLILEDGRFPDESIGYAVKLAKRMSSAISILMLYSYEGADEDEEVNGQDMLKHIMETITAEGLHVEGNIATGNKASSFLKHLALNPSLSAIVWGGNKEIGRRHMKKKEDSWFSKVKSSIQCPVVMPSMKDKSKKQRNP